MKITEDKLRQQIFNKKNINWEYISNNILLSDDFIIEFHDKLDWNGVSGFQTLNESLIKKFSNKVNWKKISYYQLLSEDFIIQHKDYVDWKEISRSQKLSEDFIVKFEDKVDWHDIFYNQNLSENFIIKFLNKFHQYIIDCCLFREISFNIIENIIKNISEYLSLNYYYYGIGRYSKRLFLKKFPFCYFDTYCQYSWKSFI